ncbi:MAG: sugar phosphate isomerase/epimerase family protein [Solirubrobacteraceae bacterium]
MTAAAVLDPAGLERLSLNQITLSQWTLPELIEGCARRGVTTIAPWRERVAEIGLHRACALIEAAGLQVSSLCRGGFFCADSAEDRRRAHEENRRAVDEAAALGAGCLVLVCGPPPGRDLAAARAMIADGILALVPVAAEAGVRLAIEPLHPMAIGERSAIVSLEEATELAARFDPAEVGVIVDVYHVFWDHRLRERIAAARGRILGFHVSDWLRQTTDTLQGRGMMGDGIIDLRTIRGWVQEAGYAGPIEVEVISRALWERDGDEMLALICRRFAEHV